MNASLVESVGAIVAAVTALTALIGVIGSLTRSARLRRQIDQIQNWLADEKSPARQQSLRHILTIYRGQLLSRQLTPLSAQLFPIFGFLLLTALGVQDAYTTVNYFANADEPYSWAAWSARFAPATADLLLYFVMLFFLIIPAPYLSLRHTLIGRARLVRDYYFARPLTPPRALLHLSGAAEGHLTWRATFAGYATGAGVYLAAAGISAIPMARSRMDDLPSDTFSYIGFFASLGVALSLVLVVGGGVESIAKALIPLRVPKRHPYKRIIVADRHWTPGH